MEEKNLFALLNKKQAFVLGAVGSFLVLCTVGFFILLGIMLSGGVKVADGSASTSFKAPKVFSQCLDGGEMAAKVSADEQLGASLGVQGTPATFVNGYLIGGALPYEAVKLVVDATLAGKDPNNEAGWDKTNYGVLEKVAIPELPDAVWLGNKDAKVTVVEFSDFECPYCNRFAPTIDKIVKDYSSQIRFTYRNFPLTSIHPSAQKAAEAFECAKAQNKGFEMYSKLFALSVSKTMSVDNFKKAASELNLK
ncbi:MAG: Periplasmic thiol:disulfide interchange protein DsbA [Candidatus Magasanikbacteria bacterium GW2011_GWC2_37_14]|uniref:Periplasmic thiol:disulfide interchange protein DsbA n=1 Tax=Candidatus Magasanikbacteria bacterium GW2011_GWC2_37_14 TaxID=1619046 RepID=A0A0G0GCN6_9BACT|nr:MAG: Periplasmic thiol:disulfide interchange protein DsbA [Candidatus Magasanikbacteria bacterium GW2011_GWC2_37_14]